jgi:hypothetical protein
MKINAHSEINQQLDDARSLHSWHFSPWLRLLTRYCDAGQNGSPAENDQVFLSTIYFCQFFVVSTLQSQIYFAMML